MGVNVSSERVHSILLLRWRGEDGSEIASELIERDIKIERSNCKADGLEETSGSHLEIVGMKRGFLSPCCTLLHFLYDNVNIPSIFGFYFFFLREEGDQLSVLVE